MVHIKIKKGLNIPFQNIENNEVQIIEKKPHFISLNLNPFEDLKLKLVKKIGDPVKIGEPIAIDKSCPDRRFVSPAAGEIQDIIRGLKRRILDIPIEVYQEEDYINFEPLDPQSTSQDNVMLRLIEGGAFPHIRKRPLDRLATPHEFPKTIFIKAIESAPFIPPPGFQVKGYEDLFQAGLATLNQLCPNQVHLIHEKNCDIKDFTEAKNVNLHSAEGPHPIANPSLHIQQIKPITTMNDIIWILGVHDVIVIGSLMIKGHYHIDKVIAIAGSAIDKTSQQYVKARTGYPIQGLIDNLKLQEPMRLISGDPLTGITCEKESYLNFYHSTLYILLENQKREFLHFFRFGLNKFSASRTYLSGILKRKKSTSFTSNQYGEERSFIDGSIYEKVMPLNIPTMELVKAVLAEDFELAVKLGLLEVASEDFALPAFICPSKIEMPFIIKKGLREYAEEYCN